MNQVPSAKHITLLSRRSFAALAVSIPLLATTYRSLARQEEDVTTVLERASLRLADVQSLHFTLEVEGETIIDDDGALRLESAEGDMARPDKVAVEFRISILGAGSVSIKMVTIGDQSWTTDLITGNWGDAPPEFGYNPAVLYDNQDGLGPVMGRLQNAAIEDTDEVDGREAYVITGTVAPAVISRLTADTMGGENVSIRLWIDQETSDILRVVLQEDDTSPKDEPARWTLNLSKFNQDVNIEPPA